MYQKGLVVRLPQGPEPPTMGQLTGNVPPMLFWRRPIEVIARLQVLLYGHDASATTGNYISFTTR